MPYEVPPFADIKVQHYEPAFEKAFAENNKEMHAIATNPDPATFENTILPFDRSGDLLGKISRVFDNLCSSNLIPELQEIQTKMVGPIQNHSTAIYMWPGLFNRVDVVYQ